MEYHIFSHFFANAFSIIISPLMNKTKPDILLNADTLSLTAHHNVIKAKSQNNIGQGLYIYIFFCFISFRWNHSRKYRISRNSPRTSEFKRRFFYTFNKNMVNLMLNMYFFYLKFTYLYFIPIHRK